MHNFYLLNACAIRKIKIPFQFALILRALHLLSSLTNYSQLTRRTLNQVNIWRLLMQKPSCQKTDL